MQCLPNSVASTHLQINAMNIPSALDLIGKLGCTRYGQVLRYEDVRQGWREGRGVKANITGIF